jgi:hypothetical protein
VHFGILRSIISDKDTIFLNASYITLWEKMNTKLKRSTTFQPQIDGQIEVVNKNLVQLVRGYNQNHTKTLDENFIYMQHSCNRATYNFIGK